ncbi:NapC/NirT family cytochrome c [Bacillus sp. ISL-18]|uniref:NapC/NirT family cytochrome c n=1 Tax=Bacillus sp. ISL-18 TaxID=2819118 RepID=UPI001BE7E726|nr:NapC/NirT family cytochrome c [Bacillus sp. ISL-18]MBT2657282.1 NapC/NirT family cytochrome c [Bacillus sp. ISL-18]
MDEEHNQELPAPPKFRYKLIKIATLTLLFLVLLSFAGFFGLETTSSSKVCTSCHEMKPEYYTWKASTHSEVACTSCHKDAVYKDLAKDKAQKLVAQLKKQSKGTSAAPIRMPGEIPNIACESCHNVFTREVTPSGDIIIPHDKHENKGVECVQCHSGVAHGKVADRKMTYTTDLDRWDSQVGTEAMSDIKFIRPDMDTCIECHKARKVTTECSACHKTGMVPKSHKKANFATKTHGLQAATNLQKCNQCHKDMSTVPIEGYEDVPAVTKYLHKDSGTIQKLKNQYDYAKENTFCKDCHSKRPASHSSSWMKDHGSEASKNKQECLACHNYQQAGGVSTTMVACASCHPALHKGFDKERHPIPLAEKQSVTEKCYTCHVKNKCAACHK